MNRTRQNLKKLTIDDFYNEIQLAKTRAYVIYEALGHPYGWSREENAIGNTINDLVADALKSFQKDGKDTSFSTGGITVKFEMDEEDMIDIEIYFGLI